MTLEEKLTQLRLMTRRLGRTDFTESHLVREV